MTKNPPREPLSFTEAATDPHSVGTAVRAVIAGGGATHAIHASVALFEAGGKLVLTEATKATVRNVAERGAEQALAFAAGPLLGPASLVTKRPIALLAQSARTARAIAPVAARTAGREVLKGAGKAAGIGFVVDGAIASVEAVVAVRSGKLSSRKAAAYVATEAATGAMATGVGVLLGAGLVALTGGIAAPVVFAVGALGSIGAKTMLRRLTNRPEAVAVREVAFVEGAVAT